MQSGRCKKTAKTRGFSRNHPENSEILAADQSSRLMRHVEQVDGGPMLTADQSSRLMRYVEQVGGGPMLSADQSSRLKPMHFKVVGWRYRISISPDGR